MARKISKAQAVGSKQNSQSAAAEAGVSDIEIMFPARTIVVNGEGVSIGEISFLASLRLQAHVSPIVKAIEAGITAGGILPGYDAIVGVLGAHWESTLVLLQEVTGRPGEWFEGLSAQDGELLLLTFWSVNAPFFYQRATTARAVAREAARLLGGEKSSQLSESADTTAASTPSGS